MSLEAAYQEHINRLQRATEDILASQAYEALVLCSGAPQSKNRFDDQSWPLSPTPAFSHWCPLVEADAYVVVRPGRKPTLVRTVVDDFWETTASPESDHFWAAFDIVTVGPGHAADVLPGGKVAVITRDPGLCPPGEVNPQPLIAALDATRTHKSTYEIDCLFEASLRAVRGHRRTEQKFRQGNCSELDVHLAYLEASEQDDPATPYKGIVALGAHSAVLHYVAYERVKVQGDTSLLVDAGARCNGYGSDITRTYVRGTGAGAKAFGELIARMDTMQQEIIRRIKPGKPYEELHDEAHQLLADVMRELGIGKASSAELVDKGITRAFFPHGLGHSLGVTTHDVGMKPRPPRPENKFLRNTSTIEVGHVFTIEPGFYTIDALMAQLQGDDRERLVDWKRVDELRPFGGIRIEDNVVVEDDGIRNLTREAYSA